MMKVYTPSEFVHSMRGVLHEYPVAIQGEASGFNINQGRLVFFELKDESSRVQCFMLAHELERTGIELEDGKEIRVLGHPSLFVRSGGFHVKVKDIQLVGKGALQKAFEELKAKLEKEGLFDEARKRPTPDFPETIGLITSSDAAAYTDVLRILKNRYPLARVIHFESRVQGLEAIPQVAEAFRYFNEHPKSADVLILTRGGGSLEDLQAFNNEDVCRAVFSSKIPVVCGVGHERDVTLAELVADVRASTPSNAAERVTPDSAELLQRIDARTRALSHMIDGRVSDVSHEVRHSATQLEDAFRVRRDRMVHAVDRFTVTSSRLAEHLALFRERVTHAQTGLAARMQTLLDIQRKKFEHRLSLLRSLGPRQTLARGYSITMLRGKAVSSVKHVLPGDSLTTRLKDGEIESSVR